MSAPKAKRRRLASLAAESKPLSPTAADLRAVRLVALEGKRVSSVRSEPVYVRRYECECVVDAYNVRGQITDRQWRAGVLFRGRWRMLVRKRAVTASYGATRGIPLRTDDVEVLFEDNRRVLTKTIDDLGPLLSGLLISVCGENEFAGASGLRPLQLALTWLADAWKIDRGYCRDAKRS